MSAETEQGGGGYWMLPGQTKNRYHTDPDCHAFTYSDKTPKQVSARRVSHLEECAFCVTGYDRSGHDGWQNKECRHCGAHAPDGHCEFCEAFEEIHNVDPEAKVESAPWPAKTPIHDDRVVEDYGDCACGRPAAWHGQCPRCWRNHQDDLCGDGLV